MWIDNNYVNPDHVTAIISRGDNGSKGCEIWLTSGGVITTKMVATQVASVMFPRPIL